MLTRPGRRAAAAESGCVHAGASIPQRQHGRSGNATVGGAGWSATVLRLHKHAAHVNFMSAHTVTEPHSRRPSVYYYTVRPYESESFRSTSCAWLRDGPAHPPGDNRESSWAKAVTPQQGSPNLTGARGSKSTQKPKIHCGFVTLAAVPSRHGRTEHVSDRLEQSNSAEALTQSHTDPLVRVDEA